MDARLRESFLRELMILQSRKTPQQQQQQQQHRQQQQQQDLQQCQVDLLLFDESGSTGRTLSGLSVACDTNLTHILLNDLKTPIGIQPSALVRLNDVIAITYR
jgi:hypothetical protein